MDQIGHHNSVEFFFTVDSENSQNFKNPTSLSLGELMCMMMAQYSYRCLKK